MKSGGGKTRLLNQILLKELSAYGKDQHGNHILSEACLAEACLRVVHQLGEAFCLPAIALTEADTLRLAASSGFIVDNYLVFDRLRSLEVTDEVSSLIDNTIAEVYLAFSGDTYGD